MAGSRPFHHAADGSGRDRVGEGERCVPSAAFGQLLVLFSDFHGDPKQRDGANDENGESSLPKRFKHALGCGTMNHDQNDEETQHHNHGANEEDSFRAGESSPSTEG